MLHVAPYRSREIQRELANENFDDKNWLTAIQLYEAIFDESSPDIEVAYRIGLSFFRLSRKQKNDDLALKARMWLHEAENGGHAAAPMYLALLYRHGLGVTQDLDKAEALMQQSAARGYAPAQNWLDNGKSNGKIISIKNDLPEELD